MKKLFLQTLAILCFITTAMSTNANSDACNKCWSDNALAATSCFTNEVTSPANYTRGEACVKDKLDKIHACMAAAGCFKTK